MSTLICFFSQTGKTRAVAEGIAEALQATISEITLTSKGKAIRPLGIKWTDQDLPEISCPVKDLTPFQEIFLGGPVWAFNVSPPVVSFINQASSWKGKKVTLFVTEFGMAGRRALRTLRTLLEKKGARVVAGKIFTSPFKSPQRLKEQGKKWVRSTKK
ncbi:MAG: hypothetical protein ABDK94_09490 [Atribacterota bacterium]